MCGANQYESVVRLDLSQRQCRYQDTLSKRQAYRSLASNLRKKRLVPGLRVAESGRGHAFANWRKASSSQLRSQAGSPRWQGRSSSSRLAWTLSKNSGGDIEKATPDPIPNSEVKLLGADGTAYASMWESRTLPGLLDDADRPRRARARNLREEAAGSRLFVVRDAVHAPRHRDHVVARAPRRTWRRHGRGGERRRRRCRPYPARFVRAVVPRVPVN